MAGLAAEEAARRKAGQAAAEEAAPLVPKGPADRVLAKLFCVIPVGMDRRPILVPADRRLAVGPPKGPDNEALVRRTVDLVRFVT